MRQDYQDRLSKLIGVWGKKLKIKVWDTADYERARKRVSRIQRNRQSQSKLRS